MDYAYSLSGNTTPLILPYQAGEAMVNRGVPVLIGGSGQEGLVLATTTAAADLVGITLDNTPSTIQTAQQSDNSDPASTIKVIVDPTAVYRAKLSGGATEDTALDLKTVTTANTAGTTVTTGDDFSSPTFDEGGIWGYSGSNVGIFRKITSVSSSAATVVTAFPYDTAVGDEFLAVPFCGSPASAEDQFVQLTSAFTQIDASVAVDTNNNNFRVLKVGFKDVSEDGRNTSYALIVPFDHLFAAGGSV